MTDLVTCNTCVHCKIDTWPKFMANRRHFKCKLEWEGEVTTNIVTGKVSDTRKYVACYPRRTNGYNALDGKCGPDGNQWSPINKNDLFKLIKRI